MTRRPLPWVLLACLGCEVVLEADPDVTVDAAPRDARPDVQPDATVDAMRCDPVPAEVRFDEVAVGERAVFALPLGCGSGLSIRDARLADVSPPDAFHLPDTLSAGPVETLRLTYTPQLIAERASAALLLFTDRGDFAVPIAGSSRWSDAACRSWRIEGVPTGITGLLRLDATPPPGVARTAAEVRWTVIERPEGSLTTLTEDFDSGAPGEGAPDDPDTPGAWFFMDAPGIYEFECTIKLPANSGCPPQIARLRAQACPCPDDVRVRLTWAADGPQPADLDLHLLHPTAAAWGAPGLDCHPGDLDPRWLQGARALDRPVHSGDDVDAPGFERIQLPRAEGVDTLTAPYRIGVFNKAEVPVDATMQVFVAERLFWTTTRTLTPNDPFWDVAGVGWFDGQLVAAAWDRLLPDADLTTPIPVGRPCLPDQPPGCAEGFRCVAEQANVGRCRR